VSGTRKSLGNFFTILVLFPLGILISILVARILGPSSRGIYAFLLLMGESLLPILFLGFGTGVIYMISSERYKAKNVILSSLLIGVLKGGLIALLLWVLWKNQLLGETAKEIPEHIFLPVLFTLPLNGLFTMSKQVFKGTSNFGLFNMASLLYTVSNLIFLTAFVVLVDWDLEGAVYSIIAQKVITVFAVLAILFYRLRPRLRIDLGYIRACYDYGIKGWIGNMATTANERFDQIILSYFANSTMLGYYAIAFSLVRFMGYFPQAVTPVMFNIIARTKEKAKSLELMAQVHRAMLVSVGLMALALGISGYWLIPLLYGEEYSSAFIPFIILVPGMFIYMASRRVINKYFGASGMPAKMSIVEGAGATVGIICYLTLIPIFGIIGAAVGSTAAYFVSTIVAHILFRRMTKGQKVNLFGVSFRDLRWIFGKLEGSFAIVGKLRRRFFKR
jgi:O-antigen/teichoic acid export membrane protein